ncbi:uncharacterized protein LOC110007728 [Amborella trichopoda]|uniref:uncharacterized protein LOC110007728 n=1 Tax=Amborella trichopoda TaxID=13333 RepID=UPI0009BD14C8|nr:uncharacterized protein LOC110007728 [Amborella trichopoda]|eukprot:XP_020526155.1 uncharacterized protein LOC110007728 [Amborella trichopoda]
MDPYLVFVRHISESSPSEGSTTVEEVVPTVAHKKKGVSPATLSATIAASKAPGERAKSKAPEVGSTQRFSGEMPATLAALFRAGCADLTPAYGASVLSRHVDMRRKF